MYTGTLINDLFAAVEGVETSARPSQSQNAAARTPQISPPGCASRKEGLQPEQLSQSPGLSAADWNLSLLLVIHAQLVGALEPGNDLADPVHIDEI
jgi:hypothetical protein